MTTATQVKIYECGCCGQFHLNELPPEANRSLHDFLRVADCRYDAGRFAGFEDAAEKLGIPEDSIVEVSIHDEDHPFFDED